MTFKFMSEVFYFHFNVHGQRFEVQMERESLLENWFLTVKNTDSKETLASFMGQKTLVPDRQTAETILRQYVKE
ncbi:hypothetical protein BegalDRAFT_2959 [Beggiatoa alba B18LD]|uniref:Uncharacterized protein n=1 Tax=Beggiatoa alba B18LD TaxID=395493 RepID=I3CJJ4_9GAMM|nr:hypothetical protein [Beggiatoa alba]EIJ43787.1 hypothetical protein BegalDRAFT_2959 [Beggiatoa alba B18LD]